MDFMQRELVYFTNRGNSKTNRYCTASAIGVADRTFLRYWLTCEVANSQS